MKKNYYLIFGVIAMALTACQTIEEDSFDFGLTAVMEATSQTKTSMSPAEAGGYNVLWSDTDKIAVYPDSETKPSTFTLTGGAGTSKATFRGDVYGDTYTAFYPENMLVSRNGKILKINLPEEQTYIPGTFATEAYPMAAFSRSKMLQFRNLCSVMRVSLKGVAKVDKLVFMPLDPSEKVSGAATVDLSNPDAPVLTMDAGASNSVTLNVDGGVQLSETEATDFYLILPPQIYADGFVVQIYTGDRFYAKRYRKDFAMERSKMHKASLVTYNGPSQANKWLTFTTRGVSSITMDNINGNEPTLYYSYDTENWEQWDYSALAFSVDSPLYLCGDNPDGFSHSQDTYSKFTVPVGAVTGDNFSVRGDIMSLINKEDDVLVIPSEYCFTNLFYDCDNLTSGPDLSATELKAYCYANMFAGCDNLATAPSLPASTLAEGCYSSMFSECSLTEAPLLAATTLADFCYEGMFYGCSSLQYVQESLPAMTLEDGCYADMFASCVSLEYTPMLPATSLAPKCYSAMFYGCSSLTATSTLPATSLEEYCYQLMFKDCVSLESAPELPATTLAEGCYMFMFSGCAGLYRVECYATDVSATDCTTGWMEDVPQDGTFIKDKDMRDWEGGANGMPYEWFVENSDQSVFAVNYLIFFADPTQASDDCRLSLDNYGGNAPIVYYSYDATNWKLWDYSDAQFSGNDVLYICGDNPDGFSKSCSEIGNSDDGVFSSFNKSEEGYNTPFHVTGDIMSLISKDEEVTTIPCDYCFCRLFKGTPSLLDAPTLSATTLTKHCYDRMFSQATDLTSPPERLPATMLKDSCYFAMFEGCSQITYAPELLATTLADGCYHSMFSGCYALQEAPELPATTLAKACYQSMFNGCGSLTDAPELPATELAEACYFKMFSGCGELVNATELSAMTLAPKCYWQMFYNCKKLQAAPDLPATTLAQDCYTSMFSRCENLSVAPEVLPATTLVKNCYNEMFYGCKNLEVAPELPATTLTPGCYYSMFNGCSKLHNIKCLATNIDADNCVTNWVQGVASSGCFVKAPAMASWTTGVSGIPADWIVMNDGDTPSGGSEGTSDEDWN